MSKKEATGESSQVEALLPILRCVACSRGKLEIGPGRDESWEEVAIPLAEESLLCTECGAKFPITADWIPVLWTPEIREYLESRNEKGSTVAANVAVYDEISDDYAVHTRQELALAMRLKAGAERLRVAGRGRGTGELSATGGRHLDFGCGPGHVLKALSGLGYRQVGLDVSLSNLRNTRKATGASVVLGDATCMPFSDGVFDLVSESSVLHHILDWRGALSEACRVSGGGILVDSEPSRDQLAWAAPARGVFEMRWPVYWALSFVDKGKYGFRDLTRAKLNYWSAEIHNQPGKGFDTDEVNELFRSAGFECELISSPDAELRSRPIIAWKHWILHLLSLHNPLDVKYGGFTALAARRD